MGREIRRVPPDWEHPKNVGVVFRPGVGYSMEVIFRPLFDEPFEDAVTRSRIENDNPRDPDHYRPAWTDAEATAYQLYETTSEGTPMSPVRATREEMIEWLTTATDALGGEDFTPMSRKGAEAFIKAGSVLTFVTRGRGIEAGLEWIDRVSQEDDLMEQDE